MQSERFQVGEEGAWERIGGERWMERNIEERKVNEACWL